MKKLTLILALLLTACGGVTITPQPTPTPEPDVILKNDETGDKTYGPAADDLERCDLLRQALKDAKANDTILLNDKRFDCDGKNKGTVHMPVNVVGKGAHLYSNVWSDDQGCAFEIESANYSGLKIENQSWQIHEDGRTLCYYEGLKKTDDNVHYAHDEQGNKIWENKTPGPFNGTLSNVTVIGNAWATYAWDGRGHTWNISDSTIVSGRQGISFMSGGGYFQAGNLERVTFDIDTSRSQDVGWTSNAVVGGGYGLMVRGGKTTCKDCVFNVKCDSSPHPASFIPRCVGLGDGGDFGSASSGWTYITLINPKFNVHGVGSKEVFDLFFVNAGAKEKLVIIGGVGSGANGEITRNW